MMDKDFSAHRGMKDQATDVDQRGNTLEGIGILAALGRKARAALAARCRWRRFAPGAVMIGRDDLGTDVLFLVAGAARVMDFAEDGREVIFGVAEAGAVLGEMAAIDGGARSANVVALEPCEVAFLAAVDFRRVLAEHPPVAMEVLKRLVRSLRLADLKLARRTTLGPVQDVARHLLHLADAGDSSAIHPMPTHDAVAAAIGAPPETVARTMAQLRQAGLTKRDGRALVLLQPERLRELADWQPAAAR
jgi:CRP/FNR family transcriptional regulator, cyclic AMP receptor protein